MLFSENTFPLGTKSSGIEKLQWSSIFCSLSCVQKIELWCLIIKVRMARICFVTFAGVRSPACAILPQVLMKVLAREWSLHTKCKIRLSWSYKTHKLDKILPRPLKLQDTWFIKRDKGSHVLITIEGDGTTMQSSLRYNLITFIFTFIERQVSSFAHIDGKIVFAI